MEKTLFELLGGRPIYEKVHKVFYDKVYDNIDLKHYFHGIDKDLISKQQTDFMISLMGGGMIFSGKTPNTCHTHMLITQELFDLRSQLLEDSLRECNVPADLARQWLDIAADSAKDLVRTDISQCKKRFFTDEIIVPRNYKGNDRNQSLSISYKQREKP